MDSRELFQRPRGVKGYVYGPLLHRTGPVCGVYFVTCEGFIKIGHAKNIRKRLEAIAGLNPHRVWLRGFIETTTQDEAKTIERDLHARFQRDHYRLEWFHFTDHIKRFIETLPIGSVQ